MRTFKIDEENNVYEIIDTYGELVELELEQHILNIVEKNLKTTEPILVLDQYENETIYN